MSETNLMTVVFDQLMTNHDLQDLDFDIKVFNIENKKESSFLYTPSWASSYHLELQFTDLSILGDEQENLTVKFNIHTFSSSQGASLNNNIVWAHPFQISGEE